MIWNSEDSNLEVIDVYSKIDSTVVNSNIDITEVLKKKSTIPTLPNNKLLDNLKIIVGKTDKGLVINEKALIDGILSSSNNLLGAYKVLPKDIQAELIKTNSKNSVETVINGIKRNIEKADLSTITGLCTLIKGLSGCNFPIKIVDKYSISVLGINIIKEVSRLGIPEAFHAFVDCIKDRDIAKNIIRGLLPYVINSSSTALLKQMGNSQYSNYIKEFVPDFIGQFSRSYKLPVNTNNNGKVSIAKDIITSFNKIDSNWNKSKLNNISVLDNICLDKCSLDFKDVMNSYISNKRIDLSKPTHKQLDQYELSIIVNKHKYVTVADRMNIDFPYLKGIK